MGEGGRRRGQVSSEALMKETRSYLCLMLPCRTAHWLATSSALSLPFGTTPTSTTSILV